MMAKAIQDAVAAHYGLTVPQLMGRNRTRNYSHPRQVAMYLTRLIAGHSITEIGDAFQRDRATVTYGLRATEQRLEADTQLKRDIAEISTALGASMTATVMITGQACARPRDKNARPKTHAAEKKGENPVTDPRTACRATHPIPRIALEGHIGILGKTGSGKSNLAKTIAEDLLSRGERLCVIDPTGTWWGLRLNADGTPSSHDVVIFGGQRPDLPIGADHGAAIAHVTALGYTR